MQKFFSLFGVVDLFELNVKLRCQKVNTACQAKHRNITNSNIIGMKVLPEFSI
jgi:hypothetical protein